MPNVIDLKSVRERRPYGERSLEERLAARLGPVHLRQRLEMESSHESTVADGIFTQQPLEDQRIVQRLVRWTLKCAGLYGRGQRNARRLHVRNHDVELPHLPAAFQGFRILQISDPHLDWDPAFADVLIRRLRELEYDLCVLTGDFRAKTYGPHVKAVKELARLRPHLEGQVYGVLGNHDSVMMLPAIEDLEVAMLVNESVAIEREDARLYLAGIDDPHYFCLDNFEDAAKNIPVGDVSILLSHSPEPYRRAAGAGFDLMLSGHTHGGQICLPGGIPLITNASCPRRYCRGAWRYRDLRGYTSVGSGSSLLDVRFNCPPEITIHRLLAAPR